MDTVFRYLSSARLRVILRIFIFRNISAFHDKSEEGRNTESEMQCLCANPVCGELPVPLTVVTVILDHTEDHFRAAIQEVGRCLFTPVEGIVVLPGEIVLTHPDCRDTLQGH